MAIWYLVSNPSSVSHIKLHLGEQVYWWLLFCDVISARTVASIALTLFYITKQWIRWTKTKNALKIHKDVLVLNSVQFLTEVSAHTQKKREQLQHSTGTRSQSAAGTLEVLRVCVFALRDFMRCECPCMCLCVLVDLQCFFAEPVSCMSVAATN